MNRKHLITLFLLVFAALSFYFLPARKSKAPVDSFNNLLPAFIKDSFFLEVANPFTQQKADLGRYLFYDRRLSFNTTKSCASCHDPKFSFTDGYRKSVGALGDLHQRNSTPLINLVFKKHLTAGDSSLHFPEQQIANPMFHDHPVELGWKGNETDILGRIASDDFYRKQFNIVFSAEKNPITTHNIQYCIASFLKTILSFNSVYDRFYYLNEKLLTASQSNGMKLFFSDKLSCYKCHGGLDFATPSVNDEEGHPAYYFNTGLYNINGTNSYPLQDRGLMEYTRQETDNGKFRVATLRNLAFTAPYYHDGSAATLSEVIDNYLNGGRVIEKGIAKGDGRLNLYKHKLINGFSLMEEERNDLINFLLCLSDSSLVTNKNYTNPFQDDETKK